MKRPKYVRRSSGQTALFGPYEWIYNPKRLTEATRRQIEELTQKGEGPIRVIQWPEGQDVWIEGQWVEPVREEPIVEQEEPEQGEIPFEEETREATRSDE